MLGIGEVAKAGAGYLKAREEAKTRRLELNDEREERRLNATSKAIERAATANGLKGLWRPVLMLMLTFLVGWYFVQLFITVGWLIWDVRFGSKEPLHDSIKLIISEYVTAGVGLTMLLGAFGGVTSWSRGKEKIAGKASSVIQSLDDFKKDAPPTVVTRKEGIEYPDEIERLPGITVPEKKRRPVSAQQKAEPVKPDPNVRHNKGYRSSKRTKGNLSTVDKPLVKVALRALSISLYDFVVIEGGRSVAEQRKHYDSGASTTMNSRHIEVPAQAFDIMAIDENRKHTWGDGTKNDPYYSEIARAMKLAASDEGIEITCGIEWGWDGGHFERSRDEVPFNWPDDFINLA